MLPLKLLPYYLQEVFQITHSIKILRPTWVKKTKSTKLTPTSKN